MFALLRKFYRHQSHLISSKVNAAVKLLVELLFGYAFGGGAAPSPRPPPSSFYVFNTKHPLFHQRHLWNGKVI